MRDSKGLIWIVCWISVSRVHSKKHNTLCIFSHFVGVGGYFLFHRSAFWVALGLFFGLKIGVSFDTIGRHWGVFIQYLTNLMHKLILPNESAIVRQENRL